jgi:large subunit ribosomal protein L5
VAGETEKPTRTARAKGKRAGASGAAKPRTRKAPAKSKSEPATPAASNGSEGPFVPRLLSIYRLEVAPVIIREFGYSNPMMAPQLSKVTVNIGLGEALTNSGSVDAATRDIATITGQKPVVTKARISIANFRLRAGMSVGVMVTLRAARMWQFVDRLVNLALPRVRDFRGVPRNSFDGRGNYTLGLREQIVFPEIDYNLIDRMRGLQMTFVTTARTDEEARRLLELLGMPFARPGEVIGFR